MYSKKYNLGECRERILRLLERYSSNGNINNTGEIADIEYRLITSLNIHLNKLWYEFPDTAAQSDVSFFCPECAFDFGSMRLGSGETVSGHFGGDKLGFYMTVKGNGQLVFNTASGQSQLYLIDTEPGMYTVIKGAIDNPGEDANFVLKADTGLDVITFVIYKNVESAAQEQELLCDKASVAAFLPGDCSKVLSLTKNNDNTNYAEYCRVDEEKRIITIPKKLSAHYILGYIPYPPNFTQDAQNSAEIALSPVMFDALCYMCAADLCPANDSELYSKLTYKYREILENIYDRQRGCRIKNSFYGLVRRRMGIALKKHGR